MGRGDGGETAHGAWCNMQIAAGLSVGKAPESEVGGVRDARAEACHRMRVNGHRRPSMTGGVARGESGKYAGQAIVVPPFLFGLHHGPETLPVRR